MADTNTTNYGWVKPENGASSDTWGTKWNENADAIDGDLKAVEGKADAAQEDADASLKTVNKLSELSGVANDARTNIGAQASHANLSALAGLTGAADRIPLFVGAGAMSLAVVTESARNLLDDANATTMQATLGLRIGGAKVWVQSATPDSPQDGDIWAW